ncbi:MAG: ribbon-helix-helix domain-containing protein [Thermoguttaceae bacterium]|nr:ribbon-helix-helix domain-containing protein [Thermoguttaceae bacterium]MDW8038464.1 ribbon-helix-helix domain-containing protein [Thermoguttaceae bacterium]
MARPKQEIITFKVDKALREAMRGIPNRSEFIRTAILRALENACPLCRGTGSLTPDQRRHWERFAQGHPLTECPDCHAVHLVCNWAKVSRD